MFVPSYTTVHGDATLAELAYYAAIERMIPSPDAIIYDDERDEYWVPPWVPPCCLLSIRRVAQLRMRTINAIGLR